MKTKDIIQAVKTLPGIEHLNAMQTAMAETDANDIVLVAPTGSGKTIAFTIRLLRTIESRRVGQGVQAVVIAPSRELVLQISDVVRSIGKGLKVTAVYGGHRFEDEANSLSVTPDIIVATPGRLLDHLNRRTVYLGGVTAVVLDEYDKSLELGFSDEMSRICRRMERARCRVLTSATILDAIPEFVSGGGAFELMDYSERSGASAMAPHIVEVPSPVRDKLDTLTALLLSIEGDKTIVFVNHRESAERVYQRLKADGFPAGIYHGQLEQTDRRHALQLFANGSTPILVATDLAARGLDIEAVDNVVHYHLPNRQQVWIHRNGRTARQGAPGTVYAIVADGETLPEFVGFDRTFVPKSLADKPINATTATLHFNAGKKEKISRGDILGFLTQIGGLDGKDVGRITVDDHEAMAAVPVDGVEALLARLRPERIKGKRVRVTRL